MEGKPHWGQSHQFRESWSDEMRSPGDLSQTDVVKMEERGISGGFKVRIVGEG